MKAIKNIEGFVGIHPIILKVGFNKRGFISVFLEDGRIIYAPLANYPSISEMNDAERKKYHITADQVIIWDTCDEVFHLEQFLGREQDYSYNSYHKALTC